MYSFKVVDGAPQWREFPIAGASNHDWEDVAYTVGPDGRGRLWVLDNITNTNGSESPKTIYEVLEPDPLTDRSAQLVGTYRWEYPGSGGNYNTETLFALDGDLVVVSKTSPNRVYRFTSPLSSSGVNLPVYQGALAVGSYLTMGSPSGDQRLFVTVSTTDVVHIIENRNTPPDLAGFLGSAPILSRSMVKSQREAGDFFPFEGCDIILVSEDQSVWRLSNQPLGFSSTTTSTTSPPTTLTSGPGLTPGWKRPTRPVTSAPRAR